MIRRKWIDNNILYSFDIIQFGYKFEFSVHPQDPEMDMSHYIVEKPSMSLIMRVKDDIATYSAALLLSAKLSMEEVKQKAREMVDNRGRRWRARQGCY